MAEIIADEKIDITDVNCPITFVKTKVALEELDEGQILQVHLNDGEPVQNVPRSIKEEGHEVLQLDDNGDGTFDVEEHDEPVYRTEQHTEYRDEPVYKYVPIYVTKYYYEIDKWVHTRDVETSGKDHEPYYGEVKLAKAAGANGIGEEREGARYGTYGFTNSKGKHFTADYDFWEYLEEGDEIEVQVDSNNHVTAW